MKNSNSFRGKKFFDELGIQNNYLRFIDDVGDYHIIVIILVFMEVEGISLFFVGLNPLIIVGSAEWFEWKLQNFVSFFPKEFSIHLSHFFGFKIDFPCQVSRNYKNKS